MTLPSSPRITKLGFFFHFFSYQAKLWNTIRINLFLVAKRNRFERENSFGRCAHCFNRFLEAGGRCSNAKFAGRINYHRAAAHSRPEDSRDKGVFLRPLRVDADSVGLS